MPAEWHRLQMVQLTWPHEGTDWSYMLQEVEECYVNLAKAISSRMQLLVVAPDIKAVKATLENGGATMSNITLFECATNDTWARDHAFITILGDNVPHYVDFCFNGWGRKFEASLDNAINGKLYDAGIVKGEYEDCTSFVLEGGSIESDGKGTILTTSQCLLAPHRNQPMGKEEIEECLKKMLMPSVYCGLTTATSSATIPTDTSIPLHALHPTTPLYICSVPMRTMHSMPTCAQWKRRLQRCALPTATLTG